MTRTRMGGRLSATVLFSAAGALVLSGAVHPGAGGTGAGPGPADAMAAMHMVEPTADAYTVHDQVLPTTWWTVTASDGGSTARRMIDGNLTTSWASPHTVGALASAGHSITIDTHALTTMSALQYLAEPGREDGRIGRFSISTSDDGTHFGAAIATGTWPDDGSRQMAEFAPVTARYVHLTALSNAGGPSLFTTVAELNLERPVASVPVATGADLPRTGWTATASDYESVKENDPPSNVLDGNPATYWHSQYSGTPAPLPHWITIALNQPTTVAGLTYLPRPGGGNGTIGQYEVAVSNDNTTWTTVASGTWLDGGAQKSATFPAVSTRYVRLTALTEAGNRGPWSSAAEINLQAPPDPAVQGQWGPVINFPIVPVSAVLLPNDKLLTFSAYSPTAFGMNDGYTQTAILDLATGVVSQRQISNTHHEMFCTGIALLSDGRVLVNGGSDSGATSIYDPATDTWTAGPTMNIPRGYEGDVTLSNGKVFTLGGSWSGGLGGKNAELYTPGGSWRLLPNITATPILTNDPQGIYRSDNHGWFFAVGGGQVFHAGPSTEMHWFTTTGGGSVTDAGPRGNATDAMNGNAVMYAVNKILVVGGSTAYQDVAATNHAYTVDISGGPSKPVVVTQLSNMAYARSFVNSVVLPNGQVFVVGGQTMPHPFSDNTAIMSPELWDPTTGQFTVMATQAVPRDYHSVAVLLPDGRVFSGGGGLCGTCTTNHLDGQIFTPPYLLNSDGTLKTRPVITSAPATATAGSTITVQTSSSVRSFALVRTGATTHTVDSDQRRIPLGAAHHTGTSYQLTIPANRGVTVPGYYLLFAINSAGTPSVAATINIP